MLSIICGSVMVAVAGGGYWRLLPRNGQVHPLVKNTDVGSMVTIAIMAALSLGVALLCEGLLG